MLIENVDDFALWLVNELTGLSDADPEALSKYVIALLKKDKSETSLRKICSDQLHVFLSDKTKKFIDDVFDCLKHKKFMKKSDVEKLSPENSMPKFVDATIKLEKTQFKVSSSDEELLPDLRKYSPNSKLKSSDDEDRRNSDYRQYSKRTREHSAYKIHDDSRKKKRFNDDIDLKEKRYHSSRHKSHKTKKHVFDRIDYPRKYLERNEESSKLIDYSNEKRLWNIKTSCPDFVEKGVCLKGDSCEFDHGQDIVRSDINCIYSGATMPLNTINSRWQPTSWGDKFPISKPNPNIVSLKTVDLSSYTQDSNNNQNMSDIYDPSHPEIDGASKNDTKKVKVVHDSAPVYVPSQVEHNQKESNPWKECDDNSTNNFEEGSRVTTVIGSGQGRHRYQRMSSPRRGRFNNNNHHNKSNDNRYNRRQGSARCLLLTHIPLDCNDEQKLRQHFRAFGKVTDVQVGFQGDQHHALIEFATNEHARAAFRSPLPILDNRFIRTSLFARSIDSNNLTLCKDNTSDDENRKRRTVIQYSGGDNEYDCVSTGDESNQGKWNRKRKVSENEIRSVVINNDHQVPQQQQHQSKSLESRDNKWPVASDLKLDRRPNDPDPTKPVIKQQSEESKSRQAEAKRDRDRKMQLLNDREEMKNRIDRLEESVQSCKKRLRILLEDQKKPDCDQELIKRQLLESYNYFKELREMLESIKKKFASQPDLSEEEKLKLKIKKLHQELVDLNENEEEHKKQLKQITELKRELVKLQTISKKTVKRPPKLPSIVETKLDNRPKTLYLTGSCSTGSLNDFRNLFKVYQLEKIEFSDNDVSFLAVKLKTRKEADRVVKELFKSLKEKNLSLSFEKPVPVCDPLDFNTRSAPAETHRGTPSRRDDCASSDEEEESKMN